MRRDAFIPFFGVVFLSLICFSSAEGACDVAGFKQYIESETTSCYDVKWCLDLQENFNYNCDEVAKKEIFDYFCGDQGKFPKFQYPPKPCDKNFFKTLMEAVTGSVADSNFCGLYQHNYMYGQIPKDFPCAATESADMYLAYCGRPLDDGHLMKTTRRPGSCDMASVKQIIEGTFKSCYDVKWFLDNQEVYNYRCSEDKKKDIMNYYCGDKGKFPSFQYPPKPCDKKFLETLLVLMNRRDTKEDRCDDFHYDIQHHYLTKDFPCDATETAQMFQAYCGYPVGPTEPTKSPPRTTKKPKGPTKSQPKRPTKSQPKRPTKSQPKRPTKSQPKRPTKSQPKRPTESPQPTKSPKEITTMKPFTCDVAKFEHQIEVMSKTKSCYWVKMFLDFQELYKFKCSAEKKNKIFDYFCGPKGTFSPFQYPPKPCDKNFLEDLAITATGYSNKKDQCNFFQRELVNRYVPKDFPCDESESAAMFQSYCGYPLGKLIPTQSTDRSASTTPYQRCTDPKILQEYFKQRRMDDCPVKLDTVTADTFTDISKDLNCKTEQLQNAYKTLCNAANTMVYSFGVAMALVVTLLNKWIFQ